MWIPYASRRKIRICVIGCGAATGTVILAMIFRKRKQV